MDQIWQFTPATNALSAIETGGGGPFRWGWDFDITPDNSKLYFLPTLGGGEDVLQMPVGGGSTSAAFLWSFDTGAIGEINLVAQ